LICHILLPSRVSDFKRSYLYYRLLAPRKKVNADRFPKLRFLGTEKGREGDIGPRRGEL